MMGVSKLAVAGSCVKVSTMFLSKNGPLTLAALDSTKQLTAIKTRTLYSSK